MQGFNMGRYVPPEFEGLRSANKIGQGILTVRFEMPFATWCGTCPKETIIGQGVRFNAEKKKVGNYHSTPIYSFRMKHAACGGWIEIRTDPANTAYVVVEGARKRDTGEDKVLEGDLPILTEEEREQRRNNAFAALEGKVTDLAQAKTDTQRIEELRQVRERDWEDTYAASRKLRATFRAERKKRARTAADTEALQTRMGLGIELLAETDEDQQRAGFVDFGEEVGADSAVFRATAKPLFADDGGPRAVNKAKRKRDKPKAVAEAERRRQMLQRELKGNTRAVVDPFLTPHSISGTQGATKLVISGLKKDRAGESTKDLRKTPAVAQICARPGKCVVLEKNPCAPLVAYDSD
ncbi:hypothetical protein B0A49_03691 [Cryomyces minteri]|uniref:Uncharacterized protein n=1 Tax=Cryomyces minteri TaxID=331657 RepID=A0A4U0XPD5_9PEZI|nr:hypothetical protein B0A49_03691 [Cryomyces minteri]